METRRGQSVWRCGGVAEAEAAGWRAGKDGAVVVSVADRGAGIPREHLPRLTERFYRVDKARSRELGGTGLGLAIVKHIVNRHRGALAIDSAPGEGSTFTVYLQPAPAAEDDALEAAALPPDERVPGASERPLRSRRHKTVTKLTYP